jgi:hypothetical protein
LIARKYQYGSLAASLNAGASWRDREVALPQCGS